MKKEEFYRYCRYKQCLPFVLSKIVHRILLIGVNFRTFCPRLVLLVLAELARERLGACITLGEVEQAIRDPSAGRSPGGDRFPTDFYKSFSDLLAPRLLTVFQDAFQRGSLPESMQNAIITLICKKDKDPQQCGSYRPLSLINVDAKILTSRIEVYLPTLIHPDQVGFIKGQSSADNLHRQCREMHSIGWRGSIYLQFLSSLG